MSQKENLDVVLLEGRGCSVVSMANGSLGCLGLGEGLLPRHRTAAREDPLRFCMPNN